MMMKESSATALYETDGRIVACDAGFIEILSEWGTQSVTLPLNLAAHPTGKDLLPHLTEMVSANHDQLGCSLMVSGCQYNVQLHRLSDQKTQLILINVSRSVTAESKEPQESDLRALRLIHDFKNQLGGLKLYAAFLKKRLASDQDGLEVCEKIIHGLNLMAERSRLVTRLVQPLVLSLADTDLSALLHHVVQDLIAEAKARDVQIELDLFAEMPLLKLDAILMRQAIYTVLNRAIHVTAAGKKVIVTAAVSGPEIVIEVHDDGPRIAAERQKTFFEIGSEAASQDGVEPHELRDEMAMHMALARRIIEHHGAYLSLSDAPIGGTSVQIHFPHSRS